MDIRFKLIPSHEGRYGKEIEIDFKLWEKSREIMEKEVE